MAPPSVKKYENKTLLKRSRSELAVNAVFAKNLFTRNQRKVKNMKDRSILDKYAVPDLPAVDTNHVLLYDSEDSLHVKKDDTFDKLKTNVEGRKLRSGKTTFASNDLSLLQTSRNTSNTSTWNLSSETLSYSSLFNSPKEESSMPSFSGAAKRKKLYFTNSSNQKESQEEIDDNLDTSIRIITKDNMNLRKVVMSSTPISGNKQLKSVNVKTPAKVTDMANCELLEKSVQQIHGWSFTLPDVEVYESVIRRRESITPPPGSLLVEYKREPLGAGLQRRARRKRKELVTPKNVLRKFASNQNPLLKRNNRNATKQQITRPLQIVIKKLPDELICKLIEKQNNYDCLPETLTHNKMSQDMSPTASVIQRDPKILKDDETKQDLPEIASVNNMKDTSDPAGSLINSVYTGKPTNNICPFESFYISMISSVLADSSMNENQDNEVNVIADDKSRMDEGDSVHQSQCHDLSELNEGRCFVTRRNRLPTRGEDIACFATPLQEALDKKLNEIKKNVDLQSPALFSSSTSDYTCIDVDIFPGSEKENEITPIPSPTRRKKLKIDKIVLLSDDSCDDSPLNESRKSLNHVVHNDSSQREVLIPLYNLNSSEEEVSYTRPVRQRETLAKFNENNSINEDVTESNITIDDSKEDIEDIIDESVHDITNDELYKRPESVEYMYNYKEMAHCHTSLTTESQTSDNLDKSQCATDESKVNIDIVEEKLVLELDEIESNLNECINVDDESNIEEILNERIESQESFKLSQRSQILQEGGECCAEENNISLYEESWPNVNKSENVTVIEECDQFEEACNPVVCKKKASTVLKKILPGKEWRRSLALIRKNALAISVLEGDMCDCSRCDLSSFCLQGIYGRKTLRCCPVELTPTSATWTLKMQYEQSRLCEAFSNLIEINDTRNRIECRDNPAESSTSVARQLVLEKCHQIAPIQFSECYPDHVLKNCMKIGEGVYGEVFLCRKFNTMATMVMKIIPIEGEILVNGERQKQYEEILSEIVIASELSNLRKGLRNKTLGYNKLINVKCVQGKYPSRLVELWELYEDNKGTENDNPSMFEGDQLYIILELANAGIDLESFIFTNYGQVYHCFLQIAMSLAVAEEELKFEHRDLHWGNILISHGPPTCIFRLQGETFKMPSYSVQANIIDFTLSRITCRGINFYNDLSQDPDLFSAEGDYQFEIYKLMQIANGNNWEPFQPKTNLLWLHYLLVKMTTAIHLIRPDIEEEQNNFFVALADLKTDILTYDSAKQFVDEHVLPIFRRL